jgi:hypothetical protein
LRAHEFGGPDAQHAALDGAESARDANWRSLRQSDASSSADRSTDRFDQPRGELALLGLDREVIEHLWRDAPQVVARSRMSAAYSAWSARERPRVSTRSALRLGRFVRAPLRTRPGHRRGTDRRRSCVGASQKASSRRLGTSGVVILRLEVGIGEYGRRGPASRAAASAASHPLLPCSPPARASACAMRIGGEQAERDRHIEIACSPP